MSAPIAPPVTVVFVSDWKRQLAVHHLVRCEHCGGMRLTHDAPHSAVWRNGVLVDCRGQVVRT